MHMHMSSKRGQWAVLHTHAGSQPIILTFVTTPNGDTLTSQAIPGESPYCRPRPSKLHLLQLGVSCRSPVARSKQRPAQQATPSDAETRL